MFRLLIIPAALLAAFSASGEAAAQATVVASSGGASFPEPLKDLGSAARGTVLVHHFKITNNHAAPLHIAGVRTSCGCSTASVLKEELQPGETSAVRVQVNTQMYSGPRTFTIYVDFDRPYLDQARLTLSAVSREDISVNPPQLAFGTVKYGSGATASAVIEQRGFSGWQVTGLEKDNGYIQPKIEPIASTSGAAAAYKLAVALREDTPPGAWHAEVTLLTSDPSAPRLRIPLTVEVEPAVTVTPKVLTLGPVTKGAKVERRAVVRGAKPFKIVKIEGADSGLTVDGVADGESKVAHVLKVAFAANDSAAVGNFSRKLRVLTDLGKEVAIELTVEGNVGP